MKLFEYSTAITGAEWPDLKTVVSPCPTLKVIGAVTKGMVQREELKRMREMGRPGIVEGADVITVSRRKKVAAATDRVVSGVLRNSIGRVARFAGRRILGKIPETAIKGSYDATKDGATTEKKAATPEDVQELMSEVAQNIEVLGGIEETLSSDDLEWKETRQETQTESVFE